ncbi:hypothetical protein HC256_001915 [Beauveria bassiana]|nr:hypothetical protein HC256_001915 [Beauveria bassiana]
MDKILFRRDSSGDDGMSKPVAELIEATESLHPSDGLCKDWEQKEEGGSDSVNRYFAALPDSHTYYQSIGVPSHLPLKDGLMQGHGYASTRPGETAETKAQANEEFIYIHRKIDPAKPFDQVPHQWTALLRAEKEPFEDEPWAMACVTLEEAAQLETEGWEV